MVVMIVMIHMELMGKLTPFRWTLRTSASKTSSGLFGLSCQAVNSKSSGLASKGDHYYRQLEGDAQQNELSFPVISHLEVQVEGKN